MTFELEDVKTAVGILSAVVTGVVAIIAFLNKKLIKPLKADRVEIKQKMTQYSETLEQHSKVLKQLEFNGGASVKDVIFKINDKLDSTKQHLDSLVAMVKASFEFDSDGIFIADKNGNCYYFNKAYLDITGLNYNEALNFGWTNAIHPKDYQKILESWKTCIEKLSNMELIHSYKNVKTKRVVKAKVSWQVQIQPDSDNNVLIFGRVKPIESNAKH